MSFKTKPGVTDEALRKAEEATQTEYLQKIPGFISRELAQGKDGLWIDIIHWENDESAKKAFDGWMN